MPPALDLCVFWGLSRSVNWWEREMTKGDGLERKKGRDDEEGPQMQAEWERTGQKLVRVFPCVCSSVDKRERERESSLYTRPMGSPVKEKRETTHTEGDQRRGGKRKMCPRWHKDQKCKTKRRSLVGAADIPTCKESAEREERGKSAGEKGKGKRKKRERDRTNEQTKKTERESTSGRRHCRATATRQRARGMGGKKTIFETGIYGNACLVASRVMVRWLQLAAKGKKRRTPGPTLPAMTVACFLVVGVSGAESVASALLLH